MPSVCLQVYRCGAIEIRRLQDPTQPTFRRLARSCDQCRSERNSRRLLELEEQSRQQERAKCVLEFFQGTRPYPHTDPERRVILATMHLNRQRLHMWCPHADTAIIEGMRVMMREDWRFIVAMRLATGNELSPDEPSPEAEFTEMLLRQAEITRTGRALTDADWHYRIEYIYLRRNRMREEVKALKGSEKFSDDIIDDIPTVDSTDDNIIPRDLLTFGKWVMMRGQPRHGLGLHGADLRNDLDKYIEYLRNYLPSCAVEVTQTLRVFHTVAKINFIEFDYRVAEGPLKPLSLNDWCDESSVFGQGMSSYNLVIKICAIEKYHAYLQSNPDWALYAEDFRNWRYRSNRLIRNLLHECPFRVDFEFGYQQTLKEFSHQPEMEEFMSSPEDLTEPDLNQRLYLLNKLSSSFKEYQGLSTIRRRGYLTTVDLLLMDNSQAEVEELNGLPSLGSPESSEDEEIIEVTQDNGECINIFGVPLPAIVPSNQQDRHPRAFQPRTTFRGRRIWGARRFI